MGGLRGRWRRGGTGVGLLRNGLSPQSRGVFVECGWDFLEPFWHEREEAGLRGHYRRRDGAGPGGGTARLAQPRRGRTGSKEPPQVNNERCEGPGTAKRSPGPCKCAGL